MIWYDISVARWSSGRTSDWWSRGGGFDSHPLHIVPLSARSGRAVLLDAWVGNRRSGVALACVTDFVGHPPTDSKAYATCAYKPIIRPWNLCYCLLLSSSVTSSHFHFERIKVINSKIFSSTCFTTVSLSMRLILQTLDLRLSCSLMLMF